MVDHEPVHDLIRVGVVDSIDAVLADSLDDAVDAGRFLVSRVLFLFGFLLLNFFPPVLDFSEANGQSDFGMSRNDGG